MPVILLLAGALCVVAGAGVLAYAYLSPEFRHLDGLMTSGSVGLVGGLILVGLGAVVGGLTRVAEASRRSRWRVCSRRR